MRPRAAPVLFAFALLAAPLAAEAEPAGKVYRVGLILTTSPVSEMAGPEPVHPLARAFVHGLRALGYVEGQNLILERRSAEGRFERLGDIVAELVRLKADVIVTVTDVTTLAAKAVTTTVPIVMIATGDPVRGGLVRSLAHPGGNITGLGTHVGPEIAAKRLQLLKEALPPPLSRRVPRQQGRQRLGEPGRKERPDGCGGPGCDAAAGGVQAA